MGTDLRSKFIDGLLSALIIMVVMFPLIMMFRLLQAWGTMSYWAAAIIFLVAGSWMLYRATLEKLSEVGQAWYGIVGGLCAWTVTEISHELGMIDIEGFDVILFLAVVIAFLAILWKYFPTGAKFWIVIFMMNWVGHVYIHIGQEFLGENAKTLFNLSAAGFGVLLVGLIYWIFARTTTRVQRLWGGLWIWQALAMFYFLLR